MKYTNIQNATVFLGKYIKQIRNYRFNYLNTQLISLLLGFFLATALSTIPAQTGDWGIIAAAIIVSLSELTSKLIYKHVHLNRLISSSLNCIRIGIIYGLFVDAFKLGS